MGRIRAMALFLSQSAASKLARGGFPVKACSGVGATRARSLNSRCSLQTKIFPDHQLRWSSRATKRSPPG